MSLVCFLSRKGAPGVTLGSLVTAAAWPSNDRRKLWLEADGDGGVLAVRYKLGLEPGLVSLAAAGRHGLAREEVWDHAQRLPGGLPVVVGSDHGDQTERVLSSSGPALGDWLSGLPDVDVIADCGRARPGSGVEQLVSRADVVAMVARPVAEQLQPAACRLVSLRPVCRSLGWVLVGDRPHDPAEVEQVYGFPVWGVLADDARGARAFELGSSGKLARSPLVRSARTLADTLIARVHPAVEAVPPMSSSPAGPAAEVPDRGDRDNRFGYGAPGTRPDANSSFPREVSR